MNKLRINYPAVIISVLVAQAISMLWYTLFAQEWMNLNELSMDDIQANQTVMPYLVSIIGHFIMVFSLAMLFRRMRIESALDGFAVGALIGFAFALIPTTVRGFFEFQPMTLAWIDGGVNIIILAVVSLILGSWRKYKITPA